MQIEKTKLDGVVILTPKVFQDERGFFTETYNSKTLHDIGIDTVFKQDNHSRSVKNVIRGLHFQLPPMAQVKLVRCSRGIIWDVAVDIRNGSPTFGQWVGVELSDTNFKQLYIPEGFAHGFCVLSDYAEVQYKCSNVYDKSREKGIIWNEPAFAVAWPVHEPLLSERDKQTASVDDYIRGTPFTYPSNE